MNIVDFIGREALSAVVADHVIAVLSVALLGQKADVASVKGSAYHTVLALEDKELDGAALVHVGIVMGLVVVERVERQAHLAVTGHSQWEGVMPVCRGADRNVLTANGIAAKLG